MWHLPCLECFQFHQSFLLNVCFKFRKFSLQTLLFSPSPFGFCTYTYCPLHALGPQVTEFISIPTTFIFLFAKVSFKRSNGRLLISPILSSLVSGFLIGRKPNLGFLYSSVSSCCFIIFAVDLDLHRGASNYKL